MDQRSKTWLNLKRQALIKYPQCQANLRISKKNHKEFQVIGVNISNPLTKETQPIQEVLKAGFTWLLGWTDDEKFLMEPRASTVIRNAHTGRKRHKHGMIRVQLRKAEKPNAWQYAPNLPTEIRHLPLADGTDTN